MGISNNDVKKMMQRLRKDVDSEIISESREDDINDLTMRDMLKITRTLNEQEENDDSSENKKTVYDQQQEEEKLRDYINNGSVNAHVRFGDLEVYDNKVIFKGIVDGVIMFLFTVTPEDSSSGAMFDYTKDFSPDNEEYKEIVKKLAYYYKHNFYPYWSNNVIEI